MKLRPHQLHAIERVEADPTGRHILNDEMGLGKTAEAIELLRRANAARTLIASPAIVRSNWRKELNMWWPLHPEVGLITMGRERTSVSKKQLELIQTAYNAPYQVVSYNLLPHIELDGWKAIVFDEVHRLKEPKTTQAVAAARLVRRNPSALILGLTGTLMPDKPLDACGIVEAMWPGRIGGLEKDGKLNYKCRFYYSNAKHNGYGWDFHGINPLHIDELRQRLASLSTRTTKLDIPNLPPFDVQYVTVPPTKTRGYKVGDRFDKEAINNVLEHASTDKLPFILQWVYDAAEQATHIAVLTHLRATAYNIAKQLEGKYNVYTITGAQTPEERNGLLERARGDKAAVIVATMHSIGIGINLEFATAALFAELYYRPETVIQALGRFSRLSSKVPSCCTILSVEGTIDEVIADKLAAKIEDIGTVVDAGVSEEKLLSSLESEDDFLAMVEAAWRSEVNDEYV
jgi:SWI/SNF-related matrix-associated actin-dependent regulator 1 of chromatin subfamily A